MDKTEKRTIMLFFFVLTVLVNQLNAGPIDANATRETRRLFRNLRNFAKTNKFIFGQQRATETGIYGWKSPYSKGEKGGWSYTSQMASENHVDELCDQKSITGDYPGLIGFNLGNKNDNQLRVISVLAKKVYKRGNIVAFHLPMDNPATGGSHSIKEDDGPVLHSIKKILPGGANHTNLVSIFDRLADFLNDFKDENGNLIPVLFRPFHENNANWYWYGQNNAANNSQQDYRDLYHFTVQYLRDTKQVHNLLYVFAPSEKYEDFNTDGRVQAYLKTYPGDDYVDVMAFDAYGHVKAEETVQIFVRHVEELVLQAESRKKIPAVAETGFQDNGIDSYHNFWMNRVLDPLKNSTGNVATRIAYLMTWTNRCSKTCTIWVPYKGHAAEQDFLDFYNDNVTVFNNEMPSLY